MKKMLTAFLSVMLSILLVFSVFAGPIDTISEMLGLISGQSTEQESTEVYEPEVETVTEPGHKEEAPASDQTDNGQPEVPEETSAEEQTKPAEPETEEGLEEAPVIKDDPESREEGVYGYSGTFDPDTAAIASVNISVGSQTLEGAQILQWENPAVQNSANSVFIAKNSYIRTETVKDTKPLEDNYENLLVAGNARATLAVGNSQNYYINSTIAARNWAALSIGSAVPAILEGQKPLSLYTYGTEAVTIDGGYGANSDISGNLFIYGSHIQGAEIGVISGTYGAVTAGTIADGEANAELSAVLSGADKDSRSDKELGSVIEGGRNALMIHSENLPGYHQFEGYSEQELLTGSAPVDMHGSVLRTDLSLDKGVEYEAQKQAYIDHTKGSVILIKSTNTEIKLDDCELSADENGTGYIVQTVINNNTELMNKVPDGETYPGINISMNNMEVKGDIAHEDYQRDLYLELKAAVIEGSVNQYDAARWKDAALNQGFSDYAPDESYGTRHGVNIRLVEGSVWNVTADSRISRLEISEDSVVNGVIILNGTEKENIPGTTYEGDVLVKPKNSGSEAETQAAQNPETQPETPTAPPETPTAPPETPTAPPETPTAPPETPSAHVHNWQHEGGYPATCLDEGAYGWVCHGCGASYTEPIPAMGHDWNMIGNFPPKCDQEGQKIYKCSRCGEVYYEDIPALGHNWVFQYSVERSCLESGYDIYECSNCGLTDMFNFEPATGHEFGWILPVDDYSHLYLCSYCAAEGGYEPHNYTVYIDPVSPTIYHVYYCPTCGHSFNEAHTGSDPCGVCGYSGPVG